MLLLLHVGLVDARLVYWWFKRDMHCVCASWLPGRTAWSTSTTPMCFCAVCSRGRHGMAYAIHMMRAVAAAAAAAAGCHVDHRAIDQFATGDAHRSVRSRMKCDQSTASKPHMGVAFSSWSMPHARIVRAWQVRCSTSPPFLAHLPTALYTYVHPLTTLLRPAYLECALPPSTTSPRAIILHFQPHPPPDSNDPRTTTTTTRPPPTATPRHTTCDIRRW